MSRRDNWRAWTPEEDDLVRKHWPDRHISPEEAARRVGRTTRAVKLRAMQIKVARFDPAERWPADRVEQLKSLWAQGKSASEIAEMFNRTDHRLGFTREAVIGKVHRLDISARRAPVGKAKPSGAAKGNRARASAALAHAVKRAKRGPVEYSPLPETLIPPGASPKTLAELPKGACKWPVGPTPPVGWGELRLFCADAVEGDGPYCACHRKTSLQKERTAEQKAVDAARAAKMRAKHAAKNGVHPHAFLFVGQGRAA